jgi:hypothetical protein
VWPRTAGVPVGFPHHDLAVAVTGLVTVTATLGDPPLRTSPSDLTHVPPLIVDGQFAVR